MNTYLGEKFGETYKTIAIILGLSKHKYFFKNGKFEKIIPITSVNKTIFFRHSEVKIKGNFTLSVRLIG